jgi:drug/metabolite transporter (DMT)-like permease
MFSGLRLSVPLIRAAAQGTITILIIFTFAFAFPSGVNAGIISSIFASSCIFTIIIFFFKYGQKVTKFDALGAFMIVLCVVLVGLGGALGSGDGEKAENKTDEELLEIRSTQTFNLIMAMVFATLTGLAFSL